MTRKTYILEGLCCPKCAAKIEKHVAALEGVSTALVDFSVQKLTIEARNAGQWDDIMTRAGGLIKRLEPSIKLRDMVLFPNLEAAKGKADSVPVSTWLRRLSPALGAALFVLGMVFEYAPSAALPPLMRLALFLASYILVGGEVLVKAAKILPKVKFSTKTF
jgi:Cd2+/Zn2+-exporting ATPase